MDTTTTAAIVAEEIRLIELLIPATRATEGGMGDPVLFRRSDRGLPIRDFVAQSNSASGVFRRFDILPVGDEVELVHYGTARELSHLVRLTIAYPTDLAFYGENEIDDLASLMESDAKQIHDKVFAPVNYLAGQHAAFATVKAPDRSFPDVWFQEIDIELQYDRTETLT